MRLIDANVLVKDFNELRNNGNWHSTELDVLDIVEEQLIYDQPTAYDVEKVVERLKEFQNEMPVPAKRYINGAIEIVRSGANE